MALQFDRVHNFDISLDEFKKIYIYTLENRFTAYLLFRSRIYILSKLNECCS